MFDRFAHFLRRPFVRLFDQTVRFDDPWERVECDVPLHRFGSGACHDFPWYFDGESTVETPSLEAVRTWLCGCAYVRDTVLFREADFWQHPCTFEQLRRGDCEDFALWTWRRLVELGYDADLVAGRCAWWREESGHAWVLFRDYDGTPHLFDPVVRDPARMVRPLDAVRDGYCPEVAVDHHFRRYAYAGYYLHRRSRREAMAAA